MVPSDAGILKVRFRQSSRVSSGIQYVEVHTQDPLHHLRCPRASDRKVCSGCLADLPHQPADSRCDRCGVAAFCPGCSADPAVTAIHDAECAAWVTMADNSTAARLGSLGQLLPSRWPPARASRPGQSHGRGFVGENRSTEQIRLVLRLLELRRRWSFGVEGSSTASASAAAEAAEEAVIVDGYDEVLTLDDHDGGEGLATDDRDQIAALGELCRHLMRAEARGSLDLCCGLLRRARCNGFGLYRQHEMELSSRRYSYPDRGLGLFPSASFFNHSCDPNCSYYYDTRGWLVIVTTAAVPLGSELNIPYISVATRRDTGPRRREVLWRQYCFDCRCPRCVRELEGTNPGRGKTQRSGASARPAKRICGGRDRGVFDLAHNHIAVFF